MLHSQVAVSPLLGSVRPPPRISRDFISARLRSVSLLSVSFFCFFIGISFQGARFNVQETFQDSRRAERSVTPRTAPRGSPQPTETRRPSNRRRLKPEKSSLPVKESSS